MTNNVNKILTKCIFLRSYPSILNREIENAIIEDLLQQLDEKKKKDNHQGRINDTILGPTCRRIL